MRTRTRLILFLSGIIALAAACLLFQMFFKSENPAIARFTRRAKAPAKPVLPSAWRRLDPSQLRLRSASVLVADRETGEILFSREPERVTSIASITKLMTAMVLLDAHLPMDEPITVTDDDVDNLKHSLSHLPVGWRLPRKDLLQLALMASENRAAAALARTFPGGTEAFVAAMNRKAADLGLTNTRFVDPHGLHAENVSTAQDLLKMLEAARDYEAIRRITTTPDFAAVSLNSGHQRVFGNSNRLVSSGRWTVEISKTGFINEAGFCLVMQAQIMNRSVAMILLDSQGKFSRMGDAARIRLWLEGAEDRMALGRAKVTTHHAG